MNFEEKVNELEKNYKSQIREVVEQGVEEEVKKALKLKKKGKWIEAIRKYILAHEAGYNALFHNHCRQEGDGHTYLNGLIGDGVATGPERALPKCCLEYAMQDSHEFPMLFLLGLGQCLNYRYERGGWDNINEENLATALRKQDYKGLGIALKMMSQYYGYPKRFIQRALVENEELTLELLEHAAPELYEKLQAERAREKENKGK